MRKFTVVLFLLFVGFMQLAFGAALKNQYCFTKPAGDTSGGADCATKACYTDGTFYYRHAGVSYKKCGAFEGGNCNQTTGGTAGNGGPICAYKYRYASLVNCTAQSNGSTSQTFYSSSYNCN